MSSLSLERLIFDPTAVADGPLIGTYIVSASGDVIDDTSGALDVNVANATIAVTQSGTWDIGTLTSITNDVNIADGGNSITVDASDLDIRDLTSASDSIEIKTAAGQALAIDGSGYITSNINGTVTVDASNLDIRDLTHASDSVKVGNGTIFLDVLVEDAASAGGENGIMALGIRRDADTSPVSDDNDLHPFVFNSIGQLKVAAAISGDVADDAADSGNPVKVGGKAYDQASVWGAVAASDRVNNATDLYRRQLINDAPNISVTCGAVSVADSATALGTAAAGRMRLLIQNNGDKPMFVGPSDVAVATGLEIAKGATLSLELGEAVDLYGIVASGTVDARVMQVA